MVDVELEMGSSDEDELESDHWKGSLGSDHVDFEPPYLEKEEKEPEVEQKTYTFVDQTNLSYFVDNTNQVDEAVKKDRMPRRTFMLQNGE
jgi:hypothetical protein